MLLFHGKTNLKDHRRDTEVSKYHPGVVVRWNRKAWVNEETTKYWVRHIYRHASPDFIDAKAPRLLVLDSLRAQITEGIRNELREINTTLSVIPSGCTGYVQVLDVALNSLLKAKIRELSEEHQDHNLEKYTEGGFSVGDRRILLTHWVAEAWEWLHLERKELIKQTFRKVGLVLNPDGSEDAEISIRDLPDIEVGEWKHSSTQFDEPEDFYDKDLAEGEWTYECSIEQLGVIEDATTDTNRDYNEAWDSDSENESAVSVAGEEDEYVQGSGGIRLGEEIVEEERDWQMT